MKNAFYLLVNIFATICIVAQNTNSEKVLTNKVLAINYSSINYNNKNLLAGFEAKLKKDSASNSIVVLGGLDSKTKNNSDKNEIFKSIRLILNEYSDNTVFVNSDGDWELGIDGLKQKKELIKENVKNKSDFQLKNGCPIEKKKINDVLDLILLDSYWSLMDWDKVPNLNVHCDIKTKEQFYAELEHEIVKSEGKTIIVAVHHPIASNGKYGNPYNFGVNPKQLNNKYYNAFKNRLLTIARQYENVVFLSGHEANFQYLKEKGVPQIIYGSADKKIKIGRAENNLFSTSEPGFPELLSYSDGSLLMNYYGESNNYAIPLFSSEIIPASIKNIKTTDLTNNTAPEYVYKSIYEPAELERSKIFRTLWGVHYINDYQTPIKLKTAILDTLHGGLVPIRKGGGHQTSSLRLESKDGKEYVMRNVKKSALRFVQYFVSKSHYLNPDVADTYFVRLLQDYWTTASPYAPLTLGEMSDALGIYHANPNIYYIPKQKALDIYNDEFGDKVYFIEERLTDGHGDVESLGYSNKIISTSDLIEAMRRKDKIKIDEELYIRTRLFDNIIGDWDRHADQWRWSEKEIVNGIKLYQPIPRDRDQAFSSFDGFMLNAVTTLTPPLRFMQVYGPNYKSVKYFNDAGDDLDRLVLMNDNKEDWLTQAKYIKEHLNEGSIDKAFKNFPAEINQNNKEQIKTALMGRINNIEENASEMYDFLHKYVTITGTDKNDRFVINRLPNGTTQVQGYRLRSSGKEDLFWDTHYYGGISKELWIYGLDGDDIFEVKGKGDKPIKIKIIGGEGNDTYGLENKHNVNVYDYRSQMNTFEKRSHIILSDNYDLNTFNFMKNRKDMSQIIPLINANPDDGIAVGLNFKHTINGLRRNPFSQQHSLRILWYSETNGINLNYTGEFANIFEKVNFELSSGYSSPLFTNNYFGYGNGTPNFDDEFGLDYNRVRLEKLFIKPSLVFRGYQGSKIQLGVSYESIEVERTSNRYIDMADIDPVNFKEQNFVGLEASYDYSNFDDGSFPKQGLGIKLTMGYKDNLKRDKSFVYASPEIRVTTRIDRKGILTYATKLKASHIFNYDFEFFQASSIGDGDGLRGFRQQRFSGKTSYYQNSDLRLSLGHIPNGFLPTKIGIYGGFDYGRVWTVDNDSNKMHTSQGGGLFFNLSGFTTANFAYFNSSDGGRLNIKFSLAF
ncbi:ShlB/FhaC/HecB family hemolysin secretion/activation protein [Mariniflexile gromovii]|uniref:Phosphoesterase n=1 Tax=Mariniflexile gromovii TaxID=362523 RepID=A0ABS4BUR9_9FLAO|nr:ShlB/FhaC/HecB family hemolysin secretion/activation protein [Mariniflexile gromovii]MBP0904311.1 phosphoesterase [Mariniflexile gromovii]